MSGGSHGATVGASIVLNRCDTAFPRLDNGAFYAVFPGARLEATGAVPRSQVQMLHSAEVYADAFHSIPLSAGFCGRVGDPALRVGACPSRVWHYVHSIGGHEVLYDEIIVASGRIECLGAAFVRARRGLATDSQHGWRMFLDVPRFCFGFCVLGVNPGISLKIFRDRSTLGLGGDWTRRLSPCLVLKISCPRQEGIPALILAYLSTSDRNGSMDATLSSRCKERVTETAMISWIKRQLRVVYGFGLD